MEGGIVVGSVIHQDYVLCARWQNEDWHFWEGKIDSGGGRGKKMYLTDFIACRPAPRRREAAQLPWLDDLTVEQEPGGSEFFNVQTGAKTLGHHDIGLIACVVPSYSMFSPGDLVQAAASRGGLCLCFDFLKALRSSLYFVCNRKAAQRLDVATRHRTDNPSQCAYSMPPGPSPNIETVGTKSFFLSMDCTTIPEL